jgi:hypothetical protein
VEAVVTDLPDLVAWLRAQIDEDERVARAAIDRTTVKDWANRSDKPDSGHWSIEDLTDDDWYAIVDQQNRQIIVYNEGRPDLHQARHIARHDPARLLAEVAAKRRLIEVAVGAIESAQPLTGNRIVRLLAQPFAGRPGWREEWAT